MPWVRPLRGMRYGVHFRAVLFCSVLCGSWGLLAAGLPSRANAQETPYCRQVRARAASDADVLMAPRVIVQGIHFPHGTQQLDSGSTTDNGYQLRTGLSFSLLDYYKGRGVLRAGDADCRRHEASNELDEALDRGADSARLSALNEQSEFLRSKSEDWRALAAKAAVRLSQRIITVFEFTTVQRSIDTLEHKLVQVEGEAAQLKAAELPAPERPAQNAFPSAQPAARDANGTTGLAAKYYREAMSFERETSRLRQLDDWKLQLTGGVIPLAPVDWYGTLELSFNLGGLVQGEHEQRYLDGRADDLRYSRDGVQTRLARFRAQTSAALEQARRDLGLLEHSLEVLRATRLALESSEAEAAAQARDMLTLEQLSVEADSVFLRKFVDVLTSLIANAKG